MKNKSLKEIITLIIVLFLLLLIPTSCVLKKIKDKQNGEIIDIKPPINNNDEVENKSDNNPINQFNNINDKVNNHSNVSNNSNKSNNSENDDISIDNTISNETQKTDTNKELPEEEIPEQDLDSDNVDANELSVRDESNKWTSTTDLNIFTKSSNEYVMSGKIAPGTNGSYAFTIRNNEDFNVVYSMKFIENNLKNINMKYRLKKGKTYLLGSKDNWVYINNKLINDIVLANSKMTNYTLEWKWFESSNDTLIGTSVGSNYGLKLTVTAEEKI